MCSSDLYVVVQTIKDAPDHIKQLERETARVKGILTAMIARSGPAQTPVLAGVDVSLVKGLAEEAETLLDAMKSFFRQATKLGADGTRKAKTVRWLMNAGNAEDLSKRLCAFYTACSVIYDVSSGYAQCRRNTHKHNLTPMQHQNRGFARTAGGTAGAPQSCGEDHRRHIGLDNIASDVQIGRAHV